VRIAADQAGAVMCMVREECGRSPVAAAFPDGTPGVAGFSRNPRAVMLVCCNARLLARHLSGDGSLAGEEAKDRPDREGNGCAAACLVDGGPGCLCDAGCDPEGDGPCPFLKDGACGLACARPARPTRLPRTAGPTGLPDTGQGTSGPAASSRDSAGQPPEGPGTGPGGLAQTPGASRPAMKGLLFRSQLREPAPDAVAPSPTPSGAGVPDPGRRSAMRGLLLKSQVR
jgi:hypothetical protein